MRLLPPDPDSGWTPYAWLVYAIPFAIWPATRPSSIGDWALNTTAVLVFLALYFWVHWLKGQRILIPVIAMALMGMALIPWNGFALCLLIYAGAFSGYTAKGRNVVIVTTTLVAALALEAWWFSLPLGFFASGAIFIPLLGFLLLHFARRDEVNQQLRQAQEEVQHLARVAERERIARDLHDLLGHTLSVIVLKSELASKVAATNPERAAKEIGEVETIAREALAEVRTAVQGYRSSGLPGEFERARALLENAGMQVKARCELPQLSPMEESVLSLALREGVTNILRHSSATACELEAVQEQGQLALTIADNGRGARGGEGSGLRGMRERVETLGGTLMRIDNEGTRLRVLLPLKGEA